MHLRETIKLELQHKIKLEYLTVLKNLKLCVLNPINIIMI